MLAQLNKHNPRRRSSLHLSLSLCFSLIQLQRKETRACFPVNLCCLFFSLLHISREQYLEKEQINRRPLQLAGVTCRRQCGHSGRPAACFLFSCFAPRRRWLLLKDLNGKRLPVKDLNLCVDVIICSSLFGKSKEMVD